MRAQRVKKRGFCYTRPFLTIVSRQAGSYEDKVTVIGYLFAFKEFKTRKNRPSSTAPKLNHAF